MNLLFINSISFDRDLYITAIHEKLVFNELPKNQKNVIKINTTKNVLQF